MSKIYIGGIDPRASEREIEDEFRSFGPIRKVWVARRPPGFAFVEYDDPRDATDAVRKLDGKHGWRVEVSRKPDARGGSRDGREGCYECGDTGHFARECPKRGGGGRGRDDRDERRRSPPRRGRSRSPPRRRSRSPPRRERSPAPARDNERRRSPSPARGGDEKPAESKRSPSPKKSSPPHETTAAVADATSV